VWRELGRAAAALARAPSLAVASLIAELGSDAQRRRWLPALAAGEAWMAAALDAVPGAPPLRAARVPDGFVLDGARSCVAAAGAARVLVPARLDDTIVLLLVDAQAATARPQVTTDEEARAELTFAGARVEADAQLGEAGDAAVARAVALVRAAACAVALGLAETQLALTAAHAQRREQFGKPIGALQAVAQRVADAFIDVEAMRLTTWEALYRLGAELPAATELSVACFWAADGGGRVSAAAQHLHGGIGFDRAHPLHRYHLAQRQLALALGVQASLAELGARWAEAQV
jgi:acyl-CoA dehydrogenase